MVVDDSAVIRGLLGRLIDREPDMVLTTTASNGESALTALRAHPTDVVLLDIEMPILDGLSAIPGLLRDCPDVRIIMVSTLTQRGAEQTIHALSLGAADYIAKPTNLRAGSGMEVISAELLAKIRALAPRRSRPSGGEAFVLRPRPAAARPPRVLVVGASTGGPNALAALLPQLSASLSLPILVVQHMPPVFTAMLAERLARETGKASGEAEDGQSIEPDRIYVAPGDYHMVVRTDGEKRILRLNQDPPENFCRPAVDPLFRSAAQAYGQEVLGVILTGMGEDGRQGSEAIAHRGGVVLAQDEATSVVWGMPGAVARAGLASAVLPLSDIPSQVLRICEVSAR
ncbi:MAG: chemotaxis response regulator protein-glutamate methylesterase [Nitrospinota bacterium]